MTKVDPEKRQMSLHEVQAIISRENAHLKRVSGKIEDLRESRAQLKTILGELRVPGNEIHHVQEKYVDIYRNTPLDEENLTEAIGHVKEQIGECRVEAEELREEILKLKELKKKAKPHVPRQKEETKHRAGSTVGSSIFGVVSSVYAYQALQGVVESDPTWVFWGAGIAVGAGFGVYKYAPPQKELLAKGKKVLHAVNPLVVAKRVVARYVRPGPLPKDLAKNAQKIPPSGGIQTFGDLESGNKVEFQEDKSEPFPGEGHRLGGE